MTQIRRSKELRELSSEELRAAYRDLSRELFDLNNELRTVRKIERPHLFRKIRRDKARVLTILREKGVDLRQIA